MVPRGLRDHLWVIFYILFRWIGHPFGDNFFEFVSVLFLNAFLIVTRNQKFQKTIPKGYQFETKMGAKSEPRPEGNTLSWICYLLYLSHMEPSQDSPRWHWKIKPRLRALSKQHFCNFSRIWGSQGTPSSDLNEGLFSKYF